MAKQKIGDRLKKRLEAVRWANERFHALVKEEGLSPDEAGEAVLAEGQERYGVDWESLLTLIMTIIQLLQSLFNRV